MISDSARKKFLGCLTRLYRGESNRIVGLRLERPVRGKALSPGRELTFCGARETKVGRLWIAVMRSSKSYTVNYMPGAAHVGAQGAAHEGAQLLQRLPQPLPQLLQLLQLFLQQLSLGRWHFGKQSFGMRHFGKRKQLFLQQPLPQPLLQQLFALQQVLAGAQQDRGAQAGAQPAGAAQVGAQAAGAAHAGAQAAGAAQFGAHAAGAAHAGAQAAGAQAAGAAQLGLQAAAQGAAHDGAGVQQAGAGAQQLL